MVMTGHLRTRSPIGWRPVIRWGVTGHRDGGMQPTLRARDRSYFDTFCGALAAADGQLVRLLLSTPVLLNACDNPDCRQQRMCVLKCAAVRKRMRVRPTARLLVIDDQHRLLFNSGP
jgi:hypothetical protein